MRSFRTLVVLVLSGAACASCSDSGSRASCAEGYYLENGECKRDDRGTGGEGGAGAAPCPEGCGELERCDEDAEPAVCACIPGYSGDPCEVSGGIGDPELEDPAQWSAANAAAVQRFGVGDQGIADGIGRFDPSVVCNNGTLSQTIRVPDLEEVGPLVAEVTYRTLSPFGVQGVRVDVGFNRAFRTLPGTVGGAWETARFCLGEAAHGETVLVRLGPSEKPQTCFESEQEAIEVDAIYLLPAEPDECPALGTALNGDAEDPSVDWFFDAEALPSGGIAEASFAAGIGQGGTRGARLFQSDGAANRAAMVTKVSVPLQATLPSPAITFWWRATAGALFRSEIGTYVSHRLQWRSLGPLIGDGEAHVSTFCLPPWTHGNVVDVSYILSSGAPGADDELVVDDIVIASDPRCGSAPDMLDPDFRSAPNRWPGVYEFDTGSPINSVTVLDDEDLADGDRGVLEVAYSNNKARVRIGLCVWVPQPEGDEGPAVTFRSFVPPLEEGETEPKTPIQWLRGRGRVVKADILPGGGWRTNRVCLPKRWAERWFRVNLAVGRSSAPYAEFEPAEKVYFDSFELTTSPACTEE